MSIIVTTTSGDRNQLKNADTWHVDDVGDLHVRKDGTRGNVATYARCLWVSVVKAEGDN